MVLASGVYFVGGRMDGHFKDLRRANLTEFISHRGAQLMIQREFEFAARTDVGVRLSDGRRLRTDRVDALREVVRSIVGSGTFNLTADGVQLALRPVELAPLEINRNLFLI